MSFGGGIVLDAEQNEPWDSVQGMCLLASPTARAGVGSGREGESLLSCRRIGLLNFGGQFKGGDDYRLYPVDLCVLGGGLP